MIKWSVLKINMQRKKGATSVNYKTEDLFFIEDENKLEKKKIHRKKFKGNLNFYNLNSFCLLDSIRKKFLKNPT